MLVEHKYMPLYYIKVHLYKYLSSVSLSICKKKC
jgi:hypothetical protein